MKMYEKPLAGRLHMFPRPYPGESFYSVLCRYHVRSGNISNSRTITELFGKPQAYLGTTLLSSQHLENIDTWIPGSSGITVMMMLYGHTAFPLYRIQISMSEKEEILRAVSGQNPMHKFNNGMQACMLNRSGLLRYCPLCAEQQRSLYGEPYWQILPQIEGIEYCPVHNVRLVSSGISVSQIEKHFYPASISIGTADADADSNHGAGHSEDVKEFLIGIAHDSEWIFENNSRLNITYHDILSAYCSLTKEWSHKGLNRGFVDIKMLEYMIPACYSDPVTGFILSKFKESLIDNGFWITRLSFFKYMILMRIFCGDAENFYRSFAQN